MKTRHSLVLCRDLRYIENDRRPDPILTSEAAATSR